MKLFCTMSRTVRPSQGHSGSALVVAICGAHDVHSNTSPTMTARAAPWIPNVEPRLRLEPHVAAASPVSHYPLRLERGHAFVTKFTGAGVN